MAAKADESKRTVLSFKNVFCLCGFQYALVGDFCECHYHIRAGNGKCQSKFQCLLMQMPCLAHSGWHFLGTSLARTCAGTATTASRHCMPWPSTSQRW